ncbi:hypothetical protein BDQ17DRAFT_1240132 [Cyathus striatus]|nr:hypothetical protein BDQ17DRAFT_1240132 [Cyathus striatus]
MDTVDPLSLQRQLATLASSPSLSHTDWSIVYHNAQSLANLLRVKSSSEDIHSLLGTTNLPQTLVTLLSLALRDRSIPSDQYAAPVLEILRVAANLCMDHDDNRSRLLDATFPDATLSLLKGYAETIPSSSQNSPLHITTPHLKVVRTAVGVLLNMSIGYEPVKLRLNSLDAAFTILSLASAIYPPTAWTKTYTQHSREESYRENWSQRSVLSAWAWRAVGELKELKDESRFYMPGTSQIFTTDVLPLLTPSLRAFCPPILESGLEPTSDSDLFDSLVQADFEALEEACTLIESLSLDIADVRLALARGLYFPAEHGGIACLTTILDFIEHGSYSPLWNHAFIESDIKRTEKAFDICKAALIKSVVEVAGEEQNDDVLWDDAEEGKPGGRFVCKMTRWIKQYTKDKDEDRPGREDLVICGSLSLGNLARREKHSTALLKPPHSLSPVLASVHFFSPSVDVKMKHAILGLLKHLAQSASLSQTIRTSLAEVKIVERISSSGIWDEKSDAMADIVQLNAIGVVKHLCSSSIEHTLVLVLSKDENPTPAGLEQILSLVSRSDSIPIKSEGTRVLVNVIKSLWSIDSSTINGVDSGEVLQKRQSAIQKVVTRGCVSALTMLVARSSKYPILVNEGFVALSLLSTHKDGGNDVSSPLVATPPPLSARPRLPVPRHALDMVVFVLRNVDNPVNFPPEVRANVCAFLVQLGRHISGEELNRLKEAVQPVLERILDNHHNGQRKEPELLIRAVKRVLESWAE